MMSWANILFHGAGLRLALLGACTGSIWSNCRKEPTRPVTATSPAATAPARPSASQPTSTQAASATAPASRPALPTSTYDPHPPYRVRLYVRKPAQKQPGWLRIAELSDAKAVATCQGVFPRRNRIEVETGNVQQLSINVGFLPLAPEKRLILSIDGQTMELARKGRGRVRLQRSESGVWHVVR
jgi:hypothetical protein